MNPNTTAWNRLRYSLYAPFYDLVARLFAPDRKRAVELAAPQPGERILLLGAGTGLDLNFLPSGCDITAVDISPAMVRRLRARAQRLGLSVDARVMDVEDLEFPDGAFDYVGLHLILAVVPDAAACAREAARVLKPNGRISILDKFLPDDQRPGLARRIVNAIANALFSDLNRQLGPLLKVADLQLQHRQPARMRGPFIVALARRRP